MQKITILCVGSLRSSWLAEGCSDYLVRLLFGIDLGIVELPASKKKDPAAQREEECERIVDALEKRDGTVWVLDESGKPMTSQVFSKELAGAKDRGDALFFVLGGAYGLNDAVRKKGRLLSLSAMTLPHELCRLVFLEQLYRAMQIAKGTGYHH